MNSDSEVQSSLLPRPKLRQSISRQESTRLVEDESYAQHFLHNLSELFGEDPSFCSDVTFVVEDELIPGHRIVLACFSDYFRGLFKMQKSSQIPISDIGKDIFKQILSFAYTGKIAISTDSVQELLVAADFLRCQSLVEKASKFMMEFTEWTNVFDIWELADYLSLAEACEKCERFVASRFDLLMEDSELKKRFLDAPPQIFQAILQSIALNMRDPLTKLPTYADEREKSVIDLIRTYCAFDSDRAELAPQLLQNCVNWMHLTAVKKETSIYGGFDEPAIGVIDTMRAAASKGVEMLRLVIAELTELKTSCPLGHPYLVLLDEYICDIAFKPTSPGEKAEKDKLLDLSFVGCDCDRRKIRQSPQNFSLNSNSKSRDQRNLRRIAEHVLKRDDGATPFLKEVIFRGFDMRANSCSSDWITKGLADGNQTGLPTDHFSQIATKEEYITSVKVTTRLWDGREVLRSIGVRFSSGRMEEHGGPGDIEKTHEVLLQQGEHVVDMRVNTGFKIDSVTFVVGKIVGREKMLTDYVGPFGGDGGSPRSAKPLDSKKGDVPFNHFLVGFEGKLTMTQGQKSVTHLRPVWRSFSCFHYEWLLSDGFFHCTNPLDFQTSDQDAAIRHRIYGPGYDDPDMDDLPSDDDDFDDDDEEDQGVIYFE